MKILFLGDVVGISGCSKIMNNLLNQIKINNIDFVIVNAENADDTGVGLTKEICEDFFRCGVNVITTGNHIWDQKNIMNFIDKENRLLRPKNLFEPAPGRGFEIYTTSKDVKTTNKTEVKLMGCEKSLPYKETIDGIVIDISSITINDLKSQYVFGFKVSNVEE